MLEFSADDVHNTTVRVRGERGRLYTVESTRDIGTTKVYRIEANSEPVLIALIERNNIMPDKVTLAGGKAMRIGKFLKSRALSYLLSRSRDCLKYPDPNGV